MRLFKLISSTFQTFTAEVKNYLAKTLTKYGEQYGPNTIFGQLINVLGATVENTMSYIEDSMVEQNKYTAQRKRSIYSLAEISGYMPSLGKAAACDVRVSFIPNNMQVTSVIINNRTPVISKSSGLKYNIILPQEAVVMNIKADNSDKVFSCVEGRFESQRFVANGGQLYSKNIIFNGEMDIDYLEVKVNDVAWTRVESLYDMGADGEQYMARTSLNNGIDIVFGNNQHGRAIKDGDVISVTYLLHSGEAGNFISGEHEEFSFADSLTDTAGNDVDGNEILLVEVESPETINAGIFSDTTEMVRDMIGMNSRSFVLADAKNYKQFFNKMSFVGYNRIWSERGSLIVNALVLQNYGSRVVKGEDYFTLKESDFILNDYQKNSIYNAIDNSGQQLAGVVFNIFDPEIVKYAMYCFVTMKDKSYDTGYVTEQIRALVGKFFTDIKSDIFIPKSDIVHLLKSEIDAIDSVDIYFISERNEKALDNHYYIEKTYKFNPGTNTYDTTEKTYYIYGNENPGLGLDSHGNILLDNNDQFPVLMGGWQFKPSYNGTASDTDVTVTDPLMIVFQ